MKLKLNSFMLIPAALIGMTVLTVLGSSAYGQQTVTVQQAQIVRIDSVRPPSPEAMAKSDAETEKKAGDWVGSLQLNDKEKEARLTAVISTHLKAVRDWNNMHPYTIVPAGIDPATGKTLSTMDRTIIANSAMPRSVHEDLMTGLRKDLTEEQVGLILDKYTIGKVAFTMAGYKAIVPDLTAQEEAAILINLQQAREQAVDFKNAKQISAIFEIYKTKNEQYLNSNGRNWHALFKAYVDTQKAKKAAAAAAGDKPSK